jgi:hypothetical protein
MSDSPQRRITSYPTIDEHEPVDGHDTVRFDLDCEDGSLERSRTDNPLVAPLDDAHTYLVVYDDSEHDHEVVLSRDTDGWEADCWQLNDEGDRIGRCRGWAFHDGPCAHLWAARSHVAQQRLEDDDARHDHHVERAMADGGHHHVEDGGRR